MSQQNLNIAPLPADLTNRFKAWQSSDYEQKRDLYKTLGQGQSPHSMIISCCDSRVHSMSLFGGESGEFFIHRNIANMVPPYEEDDGQHGTSAAIEFAVNHLKVSRLIIMGHSSCGGIKGGYDLCQKGDDSPIAETKFIQKWVKMVEPAFNRLDQTKTEDQQIADLEKTSIMVSMENLMSFPFIRDAVAENKLSLHALWHDIGHGQLYEFDPEKGEFTPL